MDEILSVSGGAGPPPVVAPRVDDRPRPQDSAAAPAGEPFDVLLREQLLQPVEEPAPTSVKFSNHAQQRLQQRDITLGDADVAKISQAVDRAQQKGGKESLILLDDMAFVVSVKNRVVITAVDQPSLKQNVFTNIDSVVIA